MLDGRVKHGKGREEVELTACMYYNTLFEQREKRNEKEE
jgi:hypothetical protein